MAEASLGPDGSKSRVVALWKDPETGVKELTLAPSKKGIWLSLCAQWTTEYTADGRSDDGHAARLVYVEHLSE